MRYLWLAVCFILGLLLPSITEPEGMHYRPFDHERFGQPCSTRTDIEEDTCNLQIKQTPDWSKRKNEQPY
jgi:hypothetical protein